MSSPVESTASRKTVSAGRLSPEEGLSIFKEMDLLELGAWAQEERFRKNPGPTVTFVIDSNPNYTNVCVTDCSFCAFYRKPGSNDSYALTVDEVMEKVAHASSLGATTVLLQGGHNPELPLDYYLNLVRETRKRFPGVTPHFFTASEIQTMSEVSGLGVREVLEKLKGAGQVSLPGGGAEVLSERVRKRISPKKGGPSKWLEVHRAAHELGFKSTATFVKITGPSNAQVENPLTTHGPKKLLKSITAGENITSGEINGGFLRVYVGIYPGADAAIDAAGGEPFTNGDKSGSYQGTLTVSATIP